MLLRQHRRQLLRLPQRSQLKVLQQFRNLQLLKLHLRLHRRPHLRNHLGWVLLVAQFRRLQVVDAQFRRLLVVQVGHRVLVVRQWEVVLLVRVLVLALAVFLQVLLVVVR